MLIFCKKKWWKHVSKTKKVGRCSGAAGDAERGFSRAESTMRSVACSVERLVWHSGEAGNGTGGTGYGFSDAGEYFWGGECI